jgi:hypothetical protein
MGLLKMKCKEATFDSLNAQVAEGGSGTNWTIRMAAVQPQYGSCLVQVFSPEVGNFANPPGTGSACDLYLFGDSKTATVTGTPLPTTGGSDASCELKITWPARNCSFVINQQQPATPTVSFTNTTFEGKNAIKATWAIEGLTYTVESTPGSVCGEPGKHTDGKYQGSVVLRGYKSGTHTAAEQVAIKYE